MTDFYFQNRCVCSTRSHGPLLCAFCLSFHFKGAGENGGKLNIIATLLKIPRNTLLRHVNGSHRVRAASVCLCV